MAERRTTLLIAGGGIGGMAAALACARQGWAVQLFERAGAFSEVGAGIQIGPNVVRLLHGWGLGQPLQAVAAFPTALCVRDVGTGRTLGRLNLAAMAQRYGAPYATVHRADLLQLLHAAVLAQPGVSLQLGQAAEGFTAGDSAVALHTRSASGQASSESGVALLGADGLWSRIRAQLLGDGAPRLTGHLAYRALLPQADLPAALRSREVTAWLGPRQHLVAYPVRGGDWMNVVGFVHGRLPGLATPSPDALADWDHGANAADLRAAFAGACQPLADLLHAIAAWRLWVLCDRPPMTAPGQHAQGRVALLGDAAHPMRPYLAQGAGMALEDAEALGRALGAVAGTTADVPAALARYAAERWQRNARVQARALRNGRIFHATGPVRLGRNLAMGLLGERLLDMPWLYGFRSGRT